MEIIQYIFIDLDNILLFRYRQTPSFVDETLFGDQLDYEAGFPSPWDTTPTHGERTRPIIFDCTDYRAKAEKENLRSGNKSSRPQSRSEHMISMLCHLIINLQDELIYLTNSCTGLINL